MRRLLCAAGPTLSAARCAARREGRRRVKSHGKRPWPSFAISVEAVTSGKVQYRRTWSPRVAQ